MPGTEEQQRTPAQTVDLASLHIGDAFENLQVVSLESQDVGLAAINSAKADALRSDAITRKWTASAIVAVFILLNAAVMSFIYCVFRTDTMLLNVVSIFKPADRLVTTQVLLSLIGSTVVQTGIVVVAIVGYLFPKRVQAADD